MAPENREADVGDAQPVSPERTKDLAALVALLSDPIKGLRTSTDLYKALGFDPDRPENQEQ